MRAVELRGKAVALATAILALAALPGPGAWAISDRGLAAVLVPAPGSSRLVLANPKRSRPLHLYLDGEPLAILPPRSWLSVDAEPGPHLLWRPVGSEEAAEGEWILLEADRAALYHFEPPYAPSASTDMEKLLGDPDSAASWILHGTDEFKPMVRTLDLHHVKPSRDDRKLLRKQMDRTRLANARAIAGDPPVLDFPARFGRVFYKDKLIRNPGVARPDSGELSISPEGITYQGEKATLEIPAASIRGLDFEGFKLVGHTPTLWFSVRYVDGEQDRSASFGRRTRYNHILAALLRMLEGRDGRPSEP